MVPAPITQRRAAFRQLFGCLFAGQLDDALCDELEATLEWMELARGDFLCREGEDADAMFLVLRGRLLALPADPTRPVLARLGPGEIVGSWAMFTDGKRSADVVADRPSHVARLSRDAFFVLGARYGDFLAAVASLAIQGVRKAQEARPGAERGGPQVLALVDLDDTPRVRAFGPALADALGLLGPTVYVHEDDLPATEGDEDLALGRRLDEAEAAARYVVCHVHTPARGVGRRLVDRADRVVLVASADGSATPAPDEPRPAEADHRLRRPLSLVLVHDRHTEQPLGTARWLDPRELDSHHHVREDRVGDVQRVARTLVGRGIGLVLGGGAALGAAHVGVLAALFERGIPIDYAGGTSAGGGVAGLLAFRSSYDEVHDLLVHSFVETNPIGRPTLPMVSLVAGEPLDRTAQEMFGEVCVEDLWLPWFGISVSLTTGERRVHRRGPMWKATRATSSVPGLMPPVLDEGELLVDGGVVDNFPSQTMRELFGGTVIGCNLTPAVPSARLDRELERLPGPFAMLWDRLLGRPRSRVPSIAQTLTRVATIGNRATHAQQREACDVYLTPPLRGFRTNDFKRFAAMARIGYTHACEQLDALELGDVFAGYGAGAEPSHQPPAAELGPASERFGRRARA